MQGIHISSWNAPVLRAMNPCVHTLPALLFLNGRAVSCLSTNFKVSYCSDSIVGL
jgi:hypothetical protein